MFVFGGGGEEQEAPLGTPCNRLAYFRSIKREPEKRRGGGGEWEFSGWDMRAPLCIVQGGQPRKPPPYTQVPPNLPTPSPATDLPGPAEEIPCLVVAVPALHQGCCFPPPRETWAE